MGFKATNNSFFDVLIDRLIVDVQREYEAARAHDNLSDVHPANNPPDSLFDEPLKNRVASVDDLVSKLVGLRVRMTTPLEHKSMATVPDNSRFSASQMKTGLTHDARLRAAPKFSSSEGEIAYLAVIKKGAQFFAEDMNADGISREALKRERRRVLLTLHPDRVPEGDREHAHQSFLAAAEAFAILAENISATRAA